MLYLHESNVMSIDKTYVENCLVSGFSRTQISEALAVSPSAITQLLDNNPEILERVNAKRAATLTRRKSIDDRLEEIEEKGWKLLNQQLSMLGDPMKILKVTMAANAAKRRGDAVSQEQPIGKTVILNMPTHVTQNFQFNSNNEAIAIGDRPLVTLPATSVRKMLQEREDEKHSWHQLPESC